MIDTSRPWEQRMQQARRWTLAWLHAWPPENYAELMEAASKVIARKLPGWKLAAPFDYRADFGASFAGTWEGGSCHDQALVLALGRNRHLLPLVGVWPD